MFLLLPWTSSMMLNRNEERRGHLHQFLTLASKRLSLSLMLSVGFFEDVLYHIEDSFPLLINWDVLSWKDDELKKKFLYQLIWSCVCCNINFGNTLINVWIFNQPCVSRISFTWLYPDVTDVLVVIFVFCLFFHYFHLILVSG